MNVTTVSTGTSTNSNTTTVVSNNKSYKIEMLDETPMSGQSDDDDDDDPPSSPGSAYGDGQDLMQITLNDEVASQLAQAGPVGVAAAAAIASARKRKRPHSFETNPSIRKRQQNRLLRKLRQIIYEFTGRVGQQAIVLVATPGKPNTSYKVFGAKPLEDVVRNLKNIVMDELETALAQQAPPPPQDDPSLFELPPLIIDGIPTPVEKMTQAQLRAFIPLMLKYSTGRGKPGWGRESTRPPWWPKELPWANVRMDARTEEEKQKISWTHALRKIVINCYRYHGREDLLPTFSDEEEKVNQLVASATRGESCNNNYTQVISTIQNADGTVSLIQVDPNNPIITLPDGTTAQVQGVATLHTTAQGETIQTVQQLTDGNGHENMTVDLTEATLGQDGQIIITGEDGQGYPVSVSNMITVPVSASMYQTMMANIQQLHPNGDGTVCITPMQVDSNAHNNNFQVFPIQHEHHQNDGGTTTGTATLIAGNNPTTITNNNNHNSSNSSSSSSNNNNNSNTVQIGHNCGRIYRAILQNPIRCFSSSQNTNNNNNNNNNISNQNNNSNNNTVAGQSNITKLSTNFVNINNNNNNYNTNNQNINNNISGIPVIDNNNTVVIKQIKKRKNLSTTIQQSQDTKKNNNKKNNNTGHNEESRIYPLLKSIKTEKIEN